jgi:hypothetical protein
MKSFVEEQKVSEQIMAVATLLATTISILSAQAAPGAPDGVASHLFTGIITQIESVFKWNNARKHAIYSALAHIPQFQTRLDAIV